MHGSSPGSRERIPRPDPRGDVPARPEGALTRILVIAGPTGTGKSRIAVRVAESLGGEVVGCDALQVYRGFDIGTAKPPHADRFRVPHHLVDCVDPRTDYHLGAYVRDAERAIENVVAAGRVPIVVGGTGMYLRGLLRGVVHAPERFPELRARLHRIARRRGSETLHRVLLGRDPESARRIPPADLQRVVRALELATGEGETWSERLGAHGTWQAQEERYDAVKVILDLPRSELSGRLDLRVREFFAAGLVREVHGLLDGGVPEDSNAFRAIGYREIVSALRDGRDPNAVEDEVRRNTRRYAKRQRTWFRREPRAIWIDASPGEAATASRIAELWNSGVNPGNG